MERSMKYKVFFLLLFAFIPESFSQDEDCDFKCRYEKLAGKELDRSVEKKSYKPSPAQSSFAKKEPLIYKKEEVQRWLDEITTEKLYYDGEPLWEQEIRFKLGNVRGNVDSFTISDISVSLNFDEIFSIDEISTRDNNRQGTLNVRFDSVNDIIEAIPGNADFKWDGDFKLLGVRLSPDLYAELEEESIYDPIMGTVFRTGVLDSFSYSAEYTQGYKNITYEDIYSFNNKLKLQQEISVLSPPKELLETYANAVKDVQVYKADYPIRFGGQTSGLIEVTNRVGDTKRPHIKLFSNLTTNSLQLEAPLFSRGSLIITSRVSNNILT